MWTMARNVGASAAEQTLQLMQQKDIRDCSESNQPHHLHHLLAHYHLLAHHHQLAHHQPSSNLQLDILEFACDKDNTVNMI